jgi:hypothetical protein
MTANRLVEILDALHWTVRGLSVILGEHQTTVQRWKEGRTQIPDPVAAWLEARARIAFARPLPDGWPRAKG